MSSEQTESWSYFYLSPGKATDYRLQTELREDNRAEGRSPSVSSYIVLCCQSNREIFSFPFLSVFQLREAPAGNLATMSALQKCLPYLLLAGQLLIFFQIEHREVQALLLAFIVFQIWKKFKTNLTEPSK